MSNVTLAERIAPLLHSGPQMAVDIHDRLADPHVSYADVRDELLAMARDGRCDAVSLLGHPVVYRGNPSKSIVDLARDHLSATASLASAKLAHATNPTTGDEDRIVLAEVKLTQATRHLNVATARKT